MREKTPGSLTRASIQERYYADGFDNTYPYLGGTDTPLVPFSGSLFVLQAHLESARYDDYDIYPQHTEAPAAFTRYRENLYLYMPHAFSMESYGIRDIPGMWTYFVDGGTVKPEYAVKNGTTVVPGYYYIPENMVQTVQNIFIKINTPGLFNLVTKFPGSGYPDLGSYPEAAGRHVGPVRGGKILQDRQHRRHGGYLPLRLRPAGQIFRELRYRAQRVQNQDGLLLHSGSVSRTRGTDGRTGRPL